MADKKYYWLKLKKGFFGRHDIKVIEAMQNGKDYVLFYLKLLVESIDHDGMLRFSDTIPYSEEMLSTITNTNVDVVRTAMKIFQELGMVEVLDDSTIFMLECEKMVGSEGWSTDRVRRLRERKKAALQSVTPASQNVTCNVEIEKEKEIELDKELEIEKDTYSSELKTSEPDIITFPCNGQKKKYGIKQSDVDAWSELYPAVDVTQELRKMRGWLDANPSKRKTHGGVKRFVTAWLSREQDKGGKGNGQAASNGDRFAGLGERI